MSALFYSLSLYKDFIKDKKGFKEESLKDQYSKYVLEKSFEYAYLIQVSFREKLLHEKSSLYLEHGIIRRFQLIMSYYEKIIVLAPATRVCPLDYEEMSTFNSNLNSLIISLTGLIDCALNVLIYETPETSVVIEGNSYNSPQSFEGNKGLISLNEKLFKILKIKKLFYDKILVDKSWYRELSNKRNYVAHGIPFRLSEANISSPVEKALKNSYLEKINQALLSKNFGPLKTLQYESNQIGTFNPTYLGFTGKKERKYDLYESLPEHVAKTINLGTTILNIATLDNRLTGESTLS